MGNGTSLRQHPNAPLTPEGRRRMVRCVIDRDWTVEATAEPFQVDAKTVRKWRDRFLAEVVDSSPTVPTTEHQVRAAPRGGPW